VVGADRTLLVALVSLVAVALNPWGLGVWQYALGLSVDPTIRRLLTEWQVTTPLSIPGAFFYLSVAGAVAALLLRRPRPVPWPSLLWLGVLVAIGVYAQRGIVWWAIGAPSIVAGILFAAPAADRASADVVRVERRSVANGALALAIVAIGVLALPWWRAATPNEGPLPLLADAPASITRALQARLTSADRVFNTQAWGSWLEFAVPDAPMFVDSRIELFPTEVWDEYLAVSGGDSGWQAILDRWGVTAVVAMVGGQDALIAELRRSPDWRQLEESDGGVAFVRE
jgi:hypothetical protein